MFGVGCLQHPYYLFRRSPSVVDVAAAETTVDLAGTTTHTQFVTAFQFSVTAGTVNAQDSPTDVQVLSTEWVVSPTTIELSFAETISYVQLTEATSVEITIPTEHTHLTVNGVETAINLPGLTTTVIAEGSTDIYVRIPATTTSLVFDGTTITLLAETITMNDGGDKCGDGNSDTLYYTVGSGDATTCYVATQIDTAVSASILYLMVSNIVGTYSVAGTTTTFVVWAGLTFTTYYTPFFKGLAWMVHGTYPNDRILECVTWWEKIGSKYR